jgi:hypothetical protein
VWAGLERFAKLEGATPGERLLLASVGYQRARASESESEAVAFLERALGDERLLGEQALDVAGILYLLLVGLLATDALHLMDETRRLRVQSAPRALAPGVWSATR